MSHSSDQEGYHLKNDVVAKWVRKLLDEQQITTLCWWIFILIILHSIGMLEYHQNPFTFWYLFKPYAHNCTKIVHNCLQATIVILDEFVHWPHRIIQQILFEWNSSTCGSISQCSFKSKYRFPIGLIKQSVTGEK